MTNEFTIPVEVSFADVLAALKKEYAALQGTTELAEAVKIRQSLEAPIVQSLRASMGDGFEKLTSNEEEQLHLFELAVVIHIAQDVRRSLDDIGLHFNGKQPAHEVTLADDLAIARKERDDAIGQVEQLTSQLADERKRLAGAIEEIEKLKTQPATDPAPPVVEEAAVEAPSPSKKASK